MQFCIQYKMQSFPPKNHVNLNVELASMVSGQYRTTSFTVEVVAWACTVITVDPILLFPSYCGFTKSCKKFQRQF